MNERKSATRRASEANSAEQAVRSQQMSQRSGRTDERASDPVLYASLPYNDSTDRGRLRDGRRVGEELMRSIGLGKRILRGEQTFGGAAVALALGVLLEGEGDGDAAIAEILAVHGFQGGVGGFEGRVVDEGEALDDGGGGGFEGEGRLIREK